MDKEKIKQEVISVLNDVTKTLWSWSDQLYFSDWQDLQRYVQQIKSLKEAAIKRRQPSDR